MRTFSIGPAVQFTAMVNSRESFTPDDEVKFIANLLQQAGYHIASIKKGDVQGQAIFAGGKYQSFVYNTASGYVIIDEDGSNWLSYWLEDAWKKVLVPEVFKTEYPDSFSGERKKREDCLIEELKKPGPLKPIIFNQFNEMIGERSSADFNGLNFCRKHLTDEDILREEGIIHLVCKGGLAVRTVSRSHKVLFCKLCGSRVTVPVETHTFGDLRQYLADWNA